MFLFKDKLNEEIDKFISQPRRSKVGITTIYLFYINRLFILFEVGKNSDHDVFRNGNLRKDNTMHVPQIYNDMFRKLLKSFYGIQLKWFYFA